MNAGRGARRWAGVAALIAAALLLFWARTAPRVEPSGSDVADPKVEPAGPSLPTLAPSSVSTSRGQVDPVPVDVDVPRVSGFAVSATWEEDGEAVIGARVLALSRQLDPQRDLLASASWIVGEAITDGSGRAVLPAPSSDAPACLWVLGPHAEVGLIVSPSRETVHAVVLRRAPTLHGTVRTADGQAVAGIGIRAWPLDIPGSGLDDLARRRPGADAALQVRETLTDSAGSFALAAWGRVPHLVRLGGGWGIAQVEADSASADRLAWRPGQGSIDFVVESLRIAQVRFLDDVSGEALTLASGLVEVAFDRKVARVWSRENDRWAFHGPAGSVVGPTSDDDPSILRYVVRLRGLPSEDPRIDATFNPAGFHATRANLLLTTPEDAPRAPIASIRLTRREGNAGGACLLECSGVEAPDGSDLGPGAIVLLRGAQGGTGGGFFVGRRIEPGSWEFRGLPEGRFTARLSLGYMTESDSAEVTLSGGKRAQVRMSFRGRGWVSFECRDEADRRIYDAAFLNLYTAEGGRAKDSIVQLSGAVTGMRLDPETAEARSGVINLSPGSYLVTCVKGGHESGQAEFEVKAGQLTRAVIRLPRRDD